MDCGKVGTRYKKRVLIVEDKEIPGRRLKKWLRRGGFDVEAAPRIAKLRESTGGRKPDLVIIDTRSNDNGNGMVAATWLRRWNPTVPIILIARHRSEGRILACIRAGISDYIKWPCSEQKLVAGLHRNLPGYKKKQAENPMDHSIIGDSQAIQEINAFIPRVSETDTTVLITGETGTGKELAAERIHKCSSREKGPFIRVNCAALPESLVESELFGYERGAFTGAVTSSQGKFEQANGGTIFLDEIADMSPYAQAKILRTLESKEICRLGGKRNVPLDVRITAATNRDPEQLMAQGDFREDLYYRLNVARIHMPPLRDHKEDIPSLVGSTIKALNQRYDRMVEGLTDAAMKSFNNYDWPGNVRELKNCLESMYINLHSRWISRENFPENFLKRLQFAEDSITNERDMVRDALASTNWNKTAAAKKLNWSRMKVYRAIERHNIVFAQ